MDDDNDQKHKDAEHATPEQEPIEQEPGAALNANPSADIEPVEDQLTLDREEGTEPTGGDGRPDGFIPSDQTIAGALTPPGGQHPGEPAGIPGVPGNLQDPHNVNGTQRNQELLAMGKGIPNPDVHKHT